jgi:hypothetical protein
VRDVQQAEKVAPVAKSSADTQAAGRTTLSDASDGEVGTEYSGGSLFTARAASSPSPDPAIAAQEPAAPSAEPQDAAAGGAAPAGPETTPAPPADAVSVSGDDNPNALERVYGDNHKHAHKPDFEHERKHAERYRPKKDKYNSKKIKSDKVSKEVAARPGVTIKTKHGRDGTFALKVKSATRYLFVNRDGKNIADPYDIIDRKDLATKNYRYKHPDREGDADGDSKRLLLNPAHSRTLLINGKPKTCVMTWIDGMTAAWMKVDDIVGGHDKIVNAVNARAGSWDPKRVSTKPDDIKKKSVPYIIRNDAVARTTPEDEKEVHGKKHPRVLDAGARGGNNVSHYLSKDQRKPAFDAHGNRITVKTGPDPDDVRNTNITRSVVALTMNLPNIKEPPIAIDTAEAGQTFFVMRAKSFWRQAPVFENGRMKSNRTMTWVFGHLGMRKGDEIVPDPTRRGWLPLRVLAEAAHLVTHDIKPRDH